MSLPQSAAIPPNGDPAAAQTPPGPNWQRLAGCAAIAAALALGLVMQWPSLQAGFRSDDYIQRAMLHGEFPVARSRFDLFDFASGTPEDSRKLIDFGYLGWWSSPELRLRMFRPLASGLIALDYSLFGDRAEWHHVHTLLWFGLLLMAAGRILFQLLPPASAALALLLYAIGPCHTVPVGWLANRSTLVATALGLLVLDLQLRGRSRALIAAAAGCALLAGEYALTALTYALVHAWVYPPPRSAGSYPSEPVARWRRLAPIVLPILGYVALRALAGGDVVGSGFYISPLHDLGAFMRAVVTRVPVLAADLLIGVPSLYYNGSSPLRGFVLSLGLFTPEVWMKLPDWTSWHVLIGYLSLALGFGLLRLLVLAGRRHSPLGWLSAAGMLSLVPCAASLPEDRLLVASTLASCALLASAFVWAFGQLLRKGAWLLRARGALIAALLAGLTAYTFGRSYRDAGSMRQGTAMMQFWALDADLPQQDAAQSRVYVLGAAEFNTAVTVPWIRLQQGKPLPLAYRRLCPGPLPLDLSRREERVLEASMLTDAGQGTATPSLYRAAKQPLHAGEHFEMPGLRVDVLRVVDGNPSQLRFTFDRSLDDPSIWFLISSYGGLRRAPLPAIGETVRLPFAQFRDLRPM